MWVSVDWELAVTVVCVLVFSGHVLLMLRGIVVVDWRSALYWHGPRWSEDSVHTVRESRAVWDCKR